MAQKQFKIGLSNTDKQNMAQDVYERVLALTFNEYDTTTEYEVGDFVVYNDQLYKCISATSGAWDSSKWQLATLNDLVDDIENAVAFVNDKANVDGNYPTMTVGVADNLSPYDESAGDDQDEPFSFQATGTGNGSQPDFSTGSIALMKEKQGNTVVVNQLAKQLATGNWGFADASGSLSDGVATFTASAQDGRMYNSSGNRHQTIKGHTYLGICDIKSVVATDLVCFYIDANPTQYIYTQANTNRQLLLKLFTATNDVSSTVIRVADNRESDWGAVTIYGVYIIDLTQWFNGNIPQDLLDNPEDFFRYYQGSLAYNEGTLVNANGRYLKAIGRNQWDEEWATGEINGLNGTNTNTGSYIRSKNFIQVVPGIEYYAKSTETIVIYEYDKDKNYIKPLYGKTNNHFKVEDNCCFIKLATATGGTTYNHDITISLYYEGESGYDQYYPYEELTNNDTGTEVLRSAGNVKDTKAPDGTIHRLVGVVDLGTLSWNWAGSGNAYTDDLKNIISANNISIIGGGFEHLGLDTSGYWAYSIDKCYYSNDVGRVYLRNANSTSSTFASLLDGVYLFYELAEPTTEQGTSFSENLVIDDFGSMDFGGNNGVPQGNLIFYPVDYKAFVDTLYKYTDGAPSKIALKSDLASDKSELQGVDTQLLNAVGGTLRHLLANANSLNAKTQTGVVDLGTLSWYYSDSGYFYSYNLQSLAVEDGHTLCSNADLINSQSGTGDKIYIGYAKILYCFYSATTDATAFKNAMKGVMLAYEKASE